MPLQLAIVTPTEEAVALTCDQVIAPGTMGELGLMPGHVPLVTALRPGVLTVTGDELRRVFAVSTGYAEIDEDQLTILTEACVESTAIKVEQVKKDVASAEAAMKDKGPVDPEFEAASVRLAWARAQLDAKSRA